MLHHDTELTKLCFEQIADPEHTFYGEFSDVFDNLSVKLELEEARQSAAASARGDRSAGEGRGDAS